MSEDDFWVENEGKDSQGGRSCKNPIPYKIWRAPSQENSQQGLERDKVSTYKEDPVLRQLRKLKVDVTL